MFPFACSNQNKVLYFKALVFVLNFKKLKFEFAFVVDFSSCID